MRITWKKFGQDIRQKRSLEKLSVRDLSRKLGISHATISRADRGLTVNAESFLVISSYFLDADARSYLR